MNKWLSICLSFCLLCSIAGADVVYIVPEGRDVEATAMAMRRLNPSLSAAEASKRASVFQDRAGAVRAELAGAAQGATRFGRYHYGTIVDYQVGPRSGDASDLANHDIIVFQPMTLDGRHVADRNVNIPAGVVIVAEHAFDTAKDFVWKFSNRHELLGTRFGSKRHRDAIYSLFDPDGAMGLASGSRISFDGALREGQITRYLLEGAQRSETDMLQWIWSAKDPTAIADWDRNGFVSLSVTHLIYALAQAKHYTQIGDEVERMAREGLSLLCSMARSDPAVAAQHTRAVAVRAREFGLSCQETLFYYFHGSDDFAGAVGFSPRHDAVLPLAFEEYRETALEFVATDDVFRSFTTFSDKDVRPRWRLTPDGPMPERMQSYGLEVLAEIASGERDDDRGTRRQRLAIQALRLMLAVDWGETAENGDVYELDRRTYRNALLVWAQRNRHSEQGLYPVPARQRWVYDQYCSIGWGHRLDMTPLAAQAQEAVWSLLEKEFRNGQLESADLRNLEANAAVLARIRKSAGRDAHEKALLLSMDNDLDARTAESAGSTLTRHVHERYTEIMNAKIVDAGLCASVM